MPMMLRVRNKNHSIASRLLSPFKKWTSKLRKPTPQESLLLLLGKKDYEEFVRVLELGTSTGQINLNHRYGESNDASTDDDDFDGFITVQSDDEDKDDTMDAIWKDEGSASDEDIDAASDYDAGKFKARKKTGTLLEIACMTKTRSKFVEKLLQSGAEINSTNPHYNLQTPLHLAAINSDTDTVRILMNTPNCDVNALDTEGAAPLHYAAYHNRFNIIRQLLQHPNIDINLITHENETVLYLALILGHRRCIPILLERPEVDLDNHKDLDGHTCRELLADKYPDQFVDRLQQIPPVPHPKESLFGLLHRNDIETFIARIKIETPSSTEHDGLRTYLQFTCNSCYARKAVEALLEAGVDPNVTCPNNRTKPIMMAAVSGCPDTLVKLLRSPKIVYESNEASELLIFTLKAMQRSLMTSHWMRCRDDNYHKCVQHILDEVPSHVLDLNYQDEHGMTALHYALETRKENTIKLLLDKGAFLFQKTKNNESPFTNVKPSLLEGYLNEGISSNDLPSNDENFEMYFNYEKFMSPKNQPVQPADPIILPEVQPLAALVNAPELKTLLTHPLLSSFIDLKWNLVRGYFYTYFMFFLTFELSLNSYSFFVIYDTYDTNEPSNQLGMIKTLLRIASLLFCGILLVNELRAIYSSIKSYLTSSENLLKYGFTLATIIFLLRPSNSRYQLVFASAAISTSWIHLVLAIGKHPSFACHLQKLKSSIRQFFKFVAWYCVIILGFGISARVLIKGNTKDPLQVYASFSVIHSVTLLISELNSGFVPFLLPTIFLIVTILSFVIFTKALLSSNTTTNKMEDKLLEIITQMRFISTIELLISRIPLKYIKFITKLADFSSSIPILGNSLSSLATTSFFDEPSNLRQIRISPNKRNKIDYLTTDRTPQATNRQWEIHPDVVKQARNIIEARHRLHVDNAENSKNPRPTEQLSQCLQNIEHKLQKVKEAVDNNEKLYEELDIHA